MKSNEKSNRLSALRVGLALGGGGARGFAHVGVLRALEECRIPIDLIVGTSMGAIIGALYAQERNAEVVEQKVLGLIESGILQGSGVQRIERLEKISRNKVLGPPVEHFIRLYRVYQHATRDHLIQDETIRAALLMLFEERRIEDLAIPFASVAVDLISGERVVFDRGPIRRAVRTSASIPGVFPPVHWNGRQLVDGAVLSLVPISAAYALGADLVVAVDVSSLLNQNPKVGNASDILIRCDQLTSRAFNTLRLAEADFVLSPLQSESSWSDFGEAADFIDEGYRATLERMKELKRILRFPRNYLRILGRKLLGHGLGVDGPVVTRVE